MGWVHEREVIADLRMGTDDVFGKSTKRSGLKDSRKYKVRIGEEQKRGPMKGVWRRCQQSQSVVPTHFRTLAFLYDIAPLINE